MCGINNRGFVDEACLDERWQLTSTCRDPDQCADGTYRAGSTACGPNGRGRLEQACQAGLWQQTNNCRDDTDVCVDGSERPGLGACGLNGRGQTRELCNSGQWAPVAGCSDPDECKDGRQETRERYERTSVPAGQTCAKEEQLRECKTGKWSGWSGSFAELSCSVLPPQCGNGRLEFGEICDDGNGQAGDGCDACQTIEPGYACATDSSARSVCTRCVVLVGPGATAQTGQRWTEAYTQLHSAIATARALVTGLQCEEVAIWVAGGRYVPAESSSAAKDCSFGLDKPVRLLGGFRGDEWAADQRDGRKHPTVLSGDRAGDDATTNSHDDNCSSVISVRGQRAVIDGFTISGGHGGSSGGGVSGYASALTLRNLKIEENSAAYGGGLDAASSQLLIENVQFVRNTATHAGGALYDFNAGAQTALLRNVEFKLNSAPTGGALAVAERPFDVQGAVFDGNTADSGGAAWFTIGGSKLSRTIFSNNSAVLGGAVFQGGGLTEQYLAIENALFTHNTASDYGGALYFSGLGSAKVSHSTFTANSAPAQHGGGVYHQSFTNHDDNGFPFDDSGRSFFYNSILWDNPGGEALGRGANVSYLPAVNCVHGRVGSDLVACAVGPTPFVDPAHGDYRLHPASPAIDHGLDSAASGMLLDLAGSARVSGSHPDLGCYEAAATP